MKTVKGLRGTYWQLQNSHRDKIGNIVNNTVITTHGVGLLLELSGGSLRKVHGCPSTAEHRKLIPNGIKLSMHVNYH